MIEHDITSDMLHNKCISTSEDGTVMSKVPDDKINEPCFYCGCIGKHIYFYDYDERGNIIRDLCICNKCKDKHSKSYCDNPVLNNIVGTYYSNRHCTHTEYETCAQCMIRNKEYVLKIFKLEKVT